MPYILLKRDDVPAGVFQTLELLPNTSQRKIPYKPVSQTGYRLVPPNETATTLTAPSPEQSLTTGLAGLTAWLMANVSSGVGAKATAILTVDTFANLASGDTFTITDGVLTVVFEIAKTVGFAGTAGNTRLSIVGATSANDVSLLCEAAINASELDVTAADDTGTVDLTNDNQNQVIVDQNATNSETLSGAGGLTDFAGASDSDAQTVAEAIVNATAILDELAFGDVGTAAGALTVAAINAALATGALNKAQVSDVLDILAGRNFVLAAGEDITVGGGDQFSPGAGGFDDDAIGFRRIYETGALRISFGVGRLSKIVADTFVHAGVAGAAVAVYNDDGSLFTG